MGEKNCVLLAYILGFDIKCLEWVQITVFSIGNRQWHSVHCCPQRTCFTRSLLGPQTLLKHLDHTQGGCGNKGFLGGAVVKRRHRFVEIPRSGRSPGAGNATTPVFLPGKLHGQRSLVGYSPWGPKESDKTG